MASTVIEALFTAKDEISESLNDISVASSGLEENVSDLQQDLTNLSNLTDISESELEDLRTTATKLSGAVEGTDSSVQGMARTMRDMRDGSITADEAVKQVRQSLFEMSSSSQIADESAEELRSSLRELAVSGELSQGWMDRLSRSVRGVNRNSIVASGQVSRLSNEFIQQAMASAEASDEATDYGRALAGLSSAAFGAVLPQEALEQAVDSTGDQMVNTGRKARALAGDLSLLSTVAGTSAFSFSSLSVNIGPFNLALRNVITQLPAILTGMSTMLALVSSLIGAFVVLGAVTGALVIGGALAFFEEFSQQFEETGEAVEALSAALKDLFTAALEPIMTEANIDLFINSVNAAADVVNRFAQFVEQMRGDVLGFVGTLDTDLAAGFEAMHDSFIMMQPVLRAFIEFFINDFPLIMVRFSELTNTISGDIGAMMNALGMLIAQLLDFASVIISVATPAVVLLLTELTAMFSVFNALPDFMSAATIAIAGLVFALSFAAVKTVALINKTRGLHAALLGEAAAGSILNVVYDALIANLGLYLKGKISLISALLATKRVLFAEMAAWLANASAQMFALSQTNMLTVAMGRQLGVMSALIAGNTTWTKAIQLTASNILLLAKRVVVLSAVLMKNLIVAIGAAIKALLVWMGQLALASVEAIFSVGAISTLTAALLGESAAATLASISTWSFVGALSALSTPALVVGAALLVLIGVLVALVQHFTEADIFAPFIQGVKDAISWVQDLIGTLDVLPGMDMDVTSVADTDDIETRPSMNLNFEESTENNMDINADPEEKGQLSRVVKDAMEEANSLERQKNGFTGN